MLALIGLLIFFMEVAVFSKSVFVALMIERIGSL